VIGDQWVLEWLITKLIIATTGRSSPLTIQTKGCPLSSNTFLHQLFAGSNGYTVKTHMMYFRMLTSNLLGCLYPLVRQPPWSTNRCQNTAFISLCWFRLAPWPSRYPWVNNTNTVNSNCYPNSPHPSWLTWQSYWSLVLRKGRARWCPSVLRKRLVAPTCSPFTRQYRYRPSIHHRCFSSYTAT
jgi:hypothetical protein